jgi:hypothetical protein
LSRHFSARAEKSPTYGPFISPCWPNPGSVDRFCGNFRDFFGFFGALKGNLKKIPPTDQTHSQEFRIHGRRRNRSLALTVGKSIVIAPPVAAKLKVSAVPVVPGAAKIAQLAATPLGTPCSAT